MALHYTNKKDLELAWSLPFAFMKLLSTKSAGCKRLHGEHAFLCIPGSARASLASCESGTFDACGSAATDAFIDLDSVGG